MAAPEEQSPPAIGICAVRERARWAFWDQTAHLVADTYVDAVQATGALAHAAAGRPSARPRRCSIGSTG